MRAAHRWLVVGLVVALAMAPHPGSGSSEAASAAEIDGEVSAALAKLFESTPKARELAKAAKGILVFPTVVKAGFMVAGLFGEGALRKGAETAGYYNTVAASYGLQAGVQKYGYALFFMNDVALKYLDQSDGFELGTGPSVVLVDQGVAAGLSTSTARDDIYAFVFDQKGLMAGLGLQGSKITRIEK
jgi:lipid-binding SYLF domain-containing protein